MPHIIRIVRNETEQYLAAKDIEGIELRLKKININNGVTFRVVIIMKSGENTMIEFWSKDEHAYDNAVNRVRLQIEQIMRGKVLPPEARDYAKLTTEMITVVFDETC